MSIDIVNLDEVKLKLEAILFSYGDWISIDSIKSLLKIEDDALIINVISEVMKKFEDGFSFKIESEEVEDFENKVMKKRWRMTLKEEYNDLITDFVSGFEMPKSALKVLSVIAYEQPVSKNRLSEILGKAVKEDVNYLYKAKFLTYEKNGIGKYYKVTKKFYDYFKMDENINFRTEANKSMKVILENPEGGFGTPVKNEEASNAKIQEEED